MGSARTATTSGVVGGDLSQSLYVVARCPDKACHQGLKAGLYLAIAGGAQGGQRATVKGAFEYHDRGLLHAALVSVEARQFDGCLVGLGAGIAEKAIVHAGDLSQGLGQLLLGFDAVQIGGVNQLVCLVPDGRGDGRVGVAQAVYGDAGYSRPGSADPRYRTGTLLRRD